MPKKQKSMVIELPQEQANAILVMLESDLESLFHFGGGIDPIADWETVHHQACLLYTSPSPRD